MNPRTQSAVVIGAIVATLALPFALGAALHHAGWRPAHGGNRGQLIQPPQPLPESGLEGRQPSDLRGRWWLVLAGDGLCEAACLARLEEMRRIHVALNRDMGRLRRMVLSTDPGDGALAALRTTQPDLVVLAPNAAWRQTFCGDGCNGMQLYVVDPQLHLTMRYAPEATADAVLADLARLLRYSSIG